MSRVLGCSEFDRTLKLLYLAPWFAAAPGSARQYGRGASDNRRTSPPHDTQSTNAMPMRPERENCSRRVTV